MIRKLVGVGLLVAGIILGHAVVEGLTLSSINDRLMMMIAVVLAGGGPILIIYDDIKRS